MALIETAVGIIVATYLTVLTVVLTYFGFADLGADERERAFDASTTEPGADRPDAVAAD